MDKDILKAIEWGIENMDHPLIKMLYKSIESSEGDIKKGKLMALGIVVLYLYKQRVRN